MPGGHACAATFPRPHPVRHTRRALDRPSAVPHGDGVQVGELLLYRGPNAMLEGWRAREEYRAFPVLDCVVGGESEAGLLVCYVGLGPI